MTRNLDAIQAALKTVDRELWIVTSADGPRRGGLLATWVSSASIDRERPVMLAGIAPNHFTAELIDASGAVGLHLIGRDQIDLALNFALGSGRARDKLSQIAAHVGASGAPLLDDCVARFDGQVFARLATGDRTFYWIEILAGEGLRQEPCARESDLFRAVSLEQKQQLLADRDADIALQRPLHDAWRRELPAHLQSPRKLN
jgi:flavin reductase (DIM6/NTAB) family NADH-FMN oxidoreductase RutF